MSTRPRQSVENLPPYAYAPTTVPGVVRIIQLGQNELCLGPSPRVSEAIARYVGTYQDYGDPAYEALRGAIAEVHGVDPARLMIGAGSVELMSYLAMAYLGTGDAAVCSKCGYKYFENVAMMAGARVVHAAERAFHVDVAAMREAVTPETRLVFLVNPGNPTGTTISGREIRRLRSDLPAEILLIVDEAYGEFGADGESALRLAAQGQNVVVLRTFSKAYGLAALRIGWGYGPPEVLATLDKIRPANSVSPLSIAAAAAAMHDQDYLAQTVAQVVSLRESLRGDLAAMGLDPQPAGGNFVLVRFPDSWPVSASAAFEALRAQGIIVRPMAGFGIPDALRITIGTLEEMAILTEALDRLARGLEPR